MESSILSSDYSWISQEAIQPQRLKFTSGLWRSLFSIVLGHSFLFNKIGVAGEMVKGRAIVLCFGPRGVYGRSFESVKMIRLCCEVPAE